MKILLGTIFVMIGLNAMAFTVTISGVFGYDADPVTVHINPTNCPGQIRGDLDEAINLWNSVPNSGLTLEVGADSTTDVSTYKQVSLNDPHIVIGCSTNFVVDSGLPSCDSNCLDSVLAVGAARSQMGNLSQGSVVINLNSGAGANYSTKDTTTRQIALAHELGHALGLGHSEYEPALMYYSVAVKKNLALSQDDMDGISYLFPRNELGDQLPLGCGTVLTGPKAPPNNPNGWLILLFPALLLFGLSLLGKLKGKTIALTQ